MSKSVEEASRELADWMEMVEERIPGLKPLLDQKRTELAQMISDMFQPFIDLADGTITEEEFGRIMAERAAEELAARQAKWADVEEDGVWVVECSEDDCYEELTYEELPPLWPTCEDLTGESCVEEDEEEL